MAFRWKFWAKNAPALQSQEVKFDSWQNPYTGLGTDRDKVYQGTYFAPYRLQDTELLALYNGSDLCATAVECRPQEMMRAGYETAATCKDDPDFEVTPDDLSEL